MACRIAWNEIIGGVTPDRTMINRQLRKGSMILAGRSMSIFEVETAVYAANEAEKTVNITLVDVKPFGNFGHLAMMGGESQAEPAQRAAVCAMESINRGSRG